MQEEFTIIVPVYNRAEIVIPTLDSIKAQTYRPIHLVVVDNSSTDNTFDVVTRWGEDNTSDAFRMSLLKEPERGAAAARNRGLQAATSDKLLFFDSDDRMHPNLVAAVMKAFTSNPDADIVTWKCRIHTLSGGVRTVHSLPGEQWGLQIYHSALRTQAYAVKRCFFNKIGAWDASMLVWDDWELGIRILLANPTMVHLDQLLVDIIAHENSITGTSYSPKAGEWEKALRRADELLDNAENDDAHKDTDFMRLHRMVAFRRIILAAHYHREHNLQLAHTLLEGTLRDPIAAFTPWQRRVMRYCYHHTRLGLRGAAIIANPFL